MTGGRLATTVYSQATQTQLRPVFALTLISTDTWWVVSTEGLARLRFEDNARGLILMLQATKTTLTAPCSDGDGCRDPRTMSVC